MHREFRLVLCAMVALGSLLFPRASEATLIDIAGSINTTLPGSGGEFADYSSPPLINGSDPIASSSVNDGTVSLSLNDTGSAKSSNSFTGTGAVYSVGAELNFQRGIVASSLSNAITNNAYLDIVISSTAYGSQLFNLDSISVSMWRNGSSAANTYQFVYDAGNNGYAIGDALGSPLDFGTNTGTANASTLTYNSSTIASNVTSATVRLYYWGAGPNDTGNTHLYNVSANYSVIPEPSSLVALGMLSLVLCGAFRRK